MTIQREQQTGTGKRGWVKNAAIIFLLIMLVLTFFSNTIMNYSLPEVAAQYAYGGGIVTQIRGTGTVAANMTYQVNIDETRVIQSVAVKSGDAVEAGQVLFYLEGTESQELKDAQKMLDSLELDYKIAELSLKNPDYTSQNLAISELKGDIEKAKTALARITADASFIADPEGAKANAQDLSESLTDRIADLNAQITELEAKLKEAETASVAAQEKKKAMDEAQKALVRLIEDYKITYNTNSVGGVSFGSSLSSNLLWFDKRYDELVGKSPDAVSPEDKTELSAIRAILDASSAYNDATLAYNAVLGSENAGLANTIDSFKTMVSGLESQKKQADKTAADADKIVTLKDQIEAYEKSLKEQQAALSTAKENDKGTQAIEQLNLEAKAQEIDKQKAKMEELSSKSGVSEIAAKMGGVVTAVNAVAGETVSAGTMLASVEVNEKGYTVSFPVTLQQAQQLRVGDAVEVQNMWWAQVTAAVSAIKNDPSKPGQGRLVECTINGEVSVGQSLDLVVGQRKTNYDTVLPNSAIREDNNGKFVLSVEAKSSPLGNRYFARRLDVQVLASDDTNSAVSGLFGGEFVVTTATKPIESGMQVRLAE